MATMSTGNLPPEIWSQILWHACVDTGYTGRAISETCRFFNDVGKPSKYRSVALQGLPQVTAFWHSIKSLPSHFVRIENLYIFVRQYDADMDEETELNHLPISIDPEVDKMQFSTVIDVLTAAAPWLVYLYLCLEMNRETIFLPIEFPHLSELVMHGQYNDHDLAQIDSLPTLLNLRRLRLSNPFGFGDDKAILAIPTCAPHVTHLRLDRHTAYSTLFISAVQDALQLSPEHSACNSKADDRGYLFPIDLKFPVSLQRLLIHPGAIYRPMCGYGMANLRRAQGALHSVVSSDSRISLFDYDQEGDRDMQPETLKEWLARINGEMAYWEENNDEGKQCWFAK